MDGGDLAGFDGAANGPGVGERQLGHSVVLMKVRVSRSVEFMFGSYRRTRETLLR